MFELRIGQAADKGMDWLQWSSSLASSLAWPVAAVAIACIFRGQIAALLKKVRKLSWGDKAVDFSEQLDKIESVAEAAPIQDDAAPPAFALPDPRVQELIAISPSAAILEAWKPIDRKLRQIYSTRFSSGTLNETAFAKNWQNRLPEMLDKLRSEKLIDRSVYIMLVELRHLRNTAAHRENITATDAVRFIDLSDTVMRELEKI